MEESALLFPIESPVSFVVPRVTDYATCDLPFPNLPLSFPKLNVLTSTDLNQLIPPNWEPVPKDNDCLFSTLGYLLYGQSHFGPALRSFICEKMLLIPWRPEQFFSETNVFTITEYLDATKMNRRGRYGGDIEIVTFCTHFKVSVAAFISSQSKWVLYRPFGTTGVPSNGSPCFLIIHYSNHWEPVSAVTSRG